MSSSAAMERNVSAGDQLPEHPFHRGRKIGDGKKLGQVGLRPTMDPGATARPSAADRCPKKARRR
jgi:hypothetical protein